MAYKKQTKKVKRHVTSAVAHVKSTFNNTLLTITTEEGDVYSLEALENQDLKVQEKGLLLQHLKSLTL